jgi:hypothetical protein
MSVEVYFVQELHIVLREEEDQAAFIDLILTLHKQPESVGFVKRELKASHRNIVQKIMDYIDLETKDESTG